MLEGRRDRGERREERGTSHPMNFAKAFAVTF